MRHGMIRRASFIALGTLAALALPAPAMAHGAVVGGGTVIIAPPRATPPFVIHRHHLLRPAPVIVVPPAILAPSRVVTQPVVIRQGHRLFLVAPGVFVPLR